MQTLISFSSHLYTIVEVLVWDSKGEEKIKLSSNFCFLFSSDISRLPQLVKNLNKARSVAFPSSLDSVFWIVFVFVVSS
jgi:hypothetical protein